MVEPDASVVVVVPPPVVEVDDDDVPVVVGGLEEEVVDDPPCAVVLEPCDVAEPFVGVVEHAATNAPAIIATSAATNGRTDRRRADRCRLDR